MQSQIIQTEIHNCSILLDPEFYSGRNFGGKAQNEKQPPLVWEIALYTYHISFVKIHPTVMKLEFYRKIHYQ